MTFGVDWPHLAAQTISFGIVCAALYAFAYRPILGMLAARREQIARGLANAAQIEKELEATRAARAEVLRQANVEAARLIEEARLAASRVETSETQKALAAAERIAASARETAAEDHARMLRELRREIGRLVIQTTSAVAGRVLTTDDQRRLAEETARQLASS
jgi:F-type H+-transporting ATPase subunit b